jgi:hypothetical protein
MRMRARGVKSEDYRGQDAPARALATTDTGRADHPLHVRHYSLFVPPRPRKRGIRRVIISNTRRKMVQCTRCPARTGYGATICSRHKKIAEGLVESRGPS